MDDATRWDEFLVAEHELIERSMAVLKSCLDDLDRAALQPARLARALDFLLEFGDRLHNAKEENHLFPRMEERGIPRQAGPIGVMLAEHQAERDLLRRLLAQAPRLAEASPADREDFRASALGYLKIRAEHIWKENDILYKMALQVLTPEDQAELLAAFRRLDQEAYGDKAREHFARMVAEQEQAGGVRTRLVENLSYEQLHGILEALPVEVTFVDADDTVAYFNRLDKKKIFTRTRSVIGRKVEKCHPAKSVDTVKAIVEGFRNRTRDSAEFWIDFAGDTIYIRYFPVYSDEGQYLGVLEVTQEIGAIRKITGQKRLLD